jgi:peptidoglycan/xylan/chitin deacetylase (PgdA/CDA1 family)
MKRLLLQCLFYLQAHRFMRLLSRRKIIILAYHGFTDKSAHEGIENNQGKHLNVDVFRSHVQHLKKYYNVIPLDRLIQHYTSGAPVPDRSVVITIDDGYESTYMLAYPILKEQAVPATVFLTTTFVENKDWLWTDRLEYALTSTTASVLEFGIAGESFSYDVHNNASKLACDSDMRSRLKFMRQELLSSAVEEVERALGRRPPTHSEMSEIYGPLEWRQVVEMIESGIISIGSHSATHVILTRCSAERARNELLLSKQLIEKRTARSCRFFCYPNGRVGCFDRDTRRVLHEVGYSCGVTTVFGMNDERSDVFELKRLYVDGRGEIVRFMMTVSGVVGVLDKMKRQLVRIVKGARAVHEKR